MLGPGDKANGHQKAGHGFLQWHQTEIRAAGKALPCAGLSFVAVCRGTLWKVFFHYNILINTSFPGGDCFPWEVSMCMSENRKTKNMFWLLASCQKVNFCTGENPMHYPVCFACNVHWPFGPHLRDQCYWSVLDAGLWGPIHLVVTWVQLASGRESFLTPLPMLRPIL